MLNANAAIFNFVIKTLCDFLTVVHNNSGPEWLAT